MSYQYIMPLLPTNLQKLDIFKRIGDLMCRNKGENSYTESDMLDYLDRIEPYVLLRDGLGVKRTELNWYSYYNWNETGNTTWNQPKKFVSQLGSSSNSILYQTEISKTYDDLMSAKDLEFNKYGFGFWQNMIDPYIGTNLIQRKILEILGIKSSYYKFEFHKIQFYIKNIQKQVFIKDDKTFSVTFPKGLIKEHFLTEAQINLKAHFYDGKKSYLEIVDLGGIKSNGEVKLNKLDIGEVKFFPIDFSILDDYDLSTYKPNEIDYNNRDYRALNPDEFITISGYVKEYERPYTQESGIIDWYQTNLPINTYDILLDQYPGDEKARALISSSIDFKNIESKLTTVKDINCANRMVLSEGSRLDYDRISDLYGSDFMGVKLCFQRYADDYINFEKSFDSDLLVNSDTSKIILTWCAPGLSDTKLIDDGIDEFYWNSLTQEEKDEIGDIFVPRNKLCFDYIYRTYDSSREQFVQLLPAYNYTNDSWSAATTWEDVFDWKTVIIDKLIGRALGVEGVINWSNQYRWSDDFRWNGHKRSYHYDKPYTGPAPEVLPGQVNWGWPDKSINRYPLSAETEKSLYDVKVNKSVRCNTPDGYGRILDGKFVFIDGNLTNECNIMDGNNFYEDREYEPYLNNAAKALLASQDGLLSEQWYLSGDSPDGIRPIANIAYHKSIEEVMQISVYSRHSLEIIFNNEENTINKNVIMSLDNLLDDNYYLSGDISDGIRPIANFNYHNRLYKIIRGSIYSKHESDYVASTANEIDRNIIMSEDSIFGEWFYLSGAVLDNTFYLRENFYNGKVDANQYLRVKGGHTLTEWVHNELGIDVSWSSFLDWSPDTDWSGDMNEQNKNNLLSQDAQFSFNMLSGKIFDGENFREFKNKNKIEWNTNIVSNHSVFIEHVALDINTDNNVLLSDDSQTAYTQISGKE